MDVINGALAADEALKVLLDLQKEVQQDVQELLFCSVSVLHGTVVLVGLTGMHKTGCSGETRLVLHVPSSS